MCYTSSMENIIIPFYTGESRHPENAYYLEEIWFFNTSRIRSTHNVLQWLFPLNERSDHYLDAPVLSEDEIQIFLTEDKLRERVIKSFHFYLKHLGLKYNEDEKIIERSIDFNEKRDWITLYSQTYLRITRVLKCLVLLGFNDFALIFFNALQDIYNEESDQIGIESLNYWKNALSV